MLKNQRDVRCLFVSKRVFEWHVKRTLQCHTMLLIPSSPSAVCLHASLPGMLPGTAWVRLRPEL